MGRCDSFVVETDVHFPTDINLLFDAVRKMIQIAAVISQGIGTSMWRQSAYNIKKFKRLYRIVQRLKHSTSKDEKKRAQKARQIMDAHKAYIELAEKYILKAESTIKMTESSDIMNAVRAEELQTYINYALWQIDLIKRRVLQDEKIPHKDKIFSIFEPHTEWISKGKAGVPQELGLRVCILEDQYGFILHHRVMEKETDDKVAVAMVTSAQNKFSDLKGCSFDKGFYTPGNKKDLKDKVEIISLLCSQAAISLENANLYKQQQDYSKTLEEKVAARTAELNQSLDTIKKTQDQLVQSEKMAALGNLVAGVAHEINTPIGVAVSAASHLSDKTGEFVDIIATGQVKKSNVNSYTHTAATSADLILKNLNTAVKIVQGFKQVAVDQASGEQREFKLKAYIEDVLLSLQPKLKKTKHAIQVDCPDDLMLNSYPGAFSQIISNLVMNSLIHGFEGIEAGEIVFDVSQTDNTVLFVYKDNGRGMTDKTLARVFDPFFTTKRSRGGSGLGMHIVHNLVTRTLGGNIACDSRPDNGITLTIQIPMTEELS